MFNKIKNFLSFEFGVNVRVNLDGVSGSFSLLRISPEDEEADLVDCVSSTTIGFVSNAQTINKTREENKDD